MTDTLQGFEHTTFTAEGDTRAVYRTGSGPAVIVISEIPGITPNVARFAHFVAAGAGRPRARPVRRPGRGCGRDVLHRGVRPGHDGGRRGTGPRAQPAVAPLSGQQGPSALHRRLRGRYQADPGTGSGGHLRPRVPLHRGQAEPTGAVRTPPRAARRRLRRRRARLVTRQSPWTPEDRPFGAHRGPRRSARHADPRRPRPGARVLRGTPWRMNPMAEAWRGRGRVVRLCDRQIFTVDLPARGTELLPPLLVLHGFPTSSFDFHRVVGGLAAHRRVLLFDMLGFGLSEKPDVAYRLAAQADLAVALTASLEIDRLGLLTHDIGDTVGGELLARQMEGSWDVEITDRV